MVFAKNSLKIAFFLILFSLSSKALAVDWSKQCLIGGKILNRVAGKCSFRKNTCDGPGTFQCGPLFNNKCIRVVDINLSSRCANKSSQENFHMSNLTEEDQFQIEAIKKYCEEASNSACRLFKRRFEEIGFEKTEAQPPCLDCEKKAATAIASSPIPKLKPHFEVKITQDSFVTSLSDHLVRNANCKCEQTTGYCTTGCMPGGRKPKQKCTGTKDMDESWKRCMRHVTAAITNTVQDMVIDYCKRINHPVTETNEDKKRCDDLIQKGELEKSLCTNSLAFPSAICAIDMDGEVPLLEEGHPACVGKPNAYCGYGEAKAKSLGIDFVVRPKSVRYGCRDSYKHNRLAGRVPIINNQGRVRIQIPF